MLDKVKDLINKMNAAGVPLPFAKNSDGKPSVSLTLLFISSLMVIMSLLGNVATYFKGIDTVNSLYWFGMCSALYYGRTPPIPGKKEEDKKE